MPELPKFEPDFSEHPNSNKRQKKKTAPTRDQKPLKYLISGKDSKGMRMILMPGDLARESETRTLSETKKVHPVSQKTLDLSDYERWNNLCAAMAEDIVLDDTPPSSPGEVDRIREHILDLVASHRRKR